MSDASVQSPPRSSVESGFFSVPSEVTVCELSEGGALLDLRSGTYFSLSAVSYSIVQALKTPATMNDVVKAVLDRFNVDEETCRADVRKHLAELEAEGLIVRKAA